MKNQGKRTLTYNPAYQMGNGHGNSGGQVFMPHASTLSFDPMRHGETAMRDRRSASARHDAGTAQGLT
jgi:hypothetical protein